jgi:uncharacterized HhH-GPD family protein
MDDVPAEVKTPFTGNAAADALLTVNPLALMVGMLLDQQVPMEWAFGAPAMLQDRLGGALDARTIAHMDRAVLEELFRAKPALHRYPGSMAKRTHALSMFIAERYGGCADNVWNDVADGDDLLDRLLALPGFGNDKARIFVGVLGKRLGVRPPGWERAAADWASIADVDAYERIGEIREQKRALKAAKRASQPGTPAGKRRAATKPTAV